ncbi:hypothetical protein [Streptomyces sp. NPDC052042]
MFVVGRDRGAAEYLGHARPERVAQGCGHFGSQGAVFYLDLAEQ